MSGPARCTRFKQMAERFPLDRHEAASCSTSVFRRKRFDPLGHFWHLLSAQVHRIGPPEGTDDLV